MLSCSLRSAFFQVAFYGCVLDQGLFVKETVKEDGYPDSDTGGVDDHEHRRPFSYELGRVMPTAYEFLLEIDVEVVGKDFSNAFSNQVYGVSRECGRWCV